MKVNLEEVTIVTRCPFCGKAQFIAVNEADYWDWQDGELAQNAFPYLSADQREAIISGICPACWDEMFGSDEEPDEDDHPIQQGMLGVVDDYALEFMEHMNDEDEDGDYWDDGCPIEDKED